GEDAEEDVGESETHGLWGTFATCLFLIKRHVANVPHENGQFRLICPAPGIGRGPSGPGGTTGPQRVMAAPTGIWVRVVNSSTTTNSTTSRHAPLISDLQTRVAFGNGATITCQRLTPSSKAHEIGSRYFRHVIIT